MFTVMGKGARPPAQMVPGKSAGTFHLEPLGHTAKSWGIMDIISQVTSLKPKWVTPLHCVSDIFMWRLTGLCMCRKTKHHGPQNNRRGAKFLFQAEQVKTASLPVSSNSQEDHPAEHEPHPS